MRYITYNLVMVLNENETEVLMCYRSKDPYKGKYNLVGGKVDEGETLLDSAYRELEEETGITKDDIILKPFIDYTWHPAKMEMSVFIGRLNKDVELQEEVHELHWMPLTEDFFDGMKFAGEGNIGHMIKIYRLYTEYVM